MAFFIPVACGIATVLTCALTYETGKGTMKTIEKRQRRKARAQNRDD